MDLKDLTIGNIIKLSEKVIDNGTNIYKLFGASFQAFQGARLFVLAYDATDDNEAGIKNKVFSSKSKKWKL